MSTHRETVFDHSGSSFDSFLEKEGILEEADAEAIKRILDWQAKNTVVDPPSTEGSE